MEFTKVEDTQGAAITLLKVPQRQQVADDDLNFDDELGDINPTVIKIIGCGGGGSSAVQRMIEDDVSGVQFVVLNTDLQALHKSTAGVRVPIGKKITGGLGAGGNPKVGEDAAREDSDRITRILSGANMIVITAGMGGGTGTGSAPVVAELAHEAGILTIAVVTTPFEFEGTVRMHNALEGLEKLRLNVDSLIVLPNDQIFKAVKNKDHKLNFREQFKLADGLLCAGVKGVTELITKPGPINLDFADVSAIMRGSGDSILGVGKGKGENRINEAVEGAISNPLLENRQIDGARKILLNMTSNGNLSLEEAQQIADLVRQSANKNANIIWGLAENAEMEDDDLAVTVIATDFDNIDETTTLMPEAEHKDDSVVGYGEFINALGGKKPANENPHTTRVSSVSTHESPFAESAHDGSSFASSKQEKVSHGSSIVAQDDRQDTAAKSNELFDTDTASFEEGGDSKPRETKKIPSTRRKLSSGIKIDPNDYDQPAVYRKRLDGLSRSINLTQF